LDPGYAALKKELEKLSDFQDKFLAEKQALHPKMDLSDIYEKYMIEMKRAAVAAGLYG
jgi:hypothetical protein